MSACTAGLPVRIPSMRVVRVIPADCG